MRQRQERSLPGLRWIYRAHGRLCAHESAAAVSHTANTARLGVEATRLALTEMGWYSREPSDPDYGVDVLAEAAPGGIPNGRLLAIQVKSGPTHVVAQSGTHVTLRCKDRHVKYWLGHSLEVIIVWYDLEQKT